MVPVNWGPARGVDDACCRVIACRTEHVGPDVRVDHRIATAADPVDCRLNLSRRESELVAVETGGRDCDISVGKSARVGLVYVACQLDPCERPGLVQIG